MATTTAFETKRDDIIRLIVDTYSNQIFEVIQELDTPSCQAMSPEQLTDIQARLSRGFADLLERGFDTVFFSESADEVS